MISIIADTSRMFKRGYKSAPYIVALLTSIVFPLNVSAQWFTVEMEGAKELIHLDTTEGALYVGSDCTPLLFFSEQLQRRSKSFKQGGKYYKVEKNRSRSLKKSTPRPRLPLAVIVDGNAVKVVSDAIAGRAQASGRIRESALAGRKGAKPCK